MSRPGYGARLVRAVALALPPHSACGRS